MRYLIQEAAVLHVARWNGKDEHKFDIRWIAREELDLCSVDHVTWHCLASCNASVAIILATRCLGNLTDELWGALVLPDDVSFVAATDAAADC